LVFKNIYTGFQNQTDEFSHAKGPGDAHAPRAAPATCERSAVPLQLARGVVRDEEGARGGEGIPEAAEELRADGGGHEGATELLEGALRFRQRGLGAGRRRAERDMKKTSENGDFFLPLRFF
jgi:hypothetical protein